MYEELINRLRGPYDSRYDSTVMLQAADAIEEMNKCLDGIDADNEYLCDRLMKLEADNAKHQWISVEERLPEKDQEVLVWLFGSYPYIAWVDGDNVWRTEEFIVDEDYLPKYWMPLPDPPNAEPQPRCRCGGLLSEAREHNGVRYRHCYSCHFEFPVEEEEK